MKKAIGIIILGLLVVSCVNGVSVFCENCKSPDGFIGFHQWSVVTSVGSGNYYIEGDRALDAMNGARAYCSGSGKSFKAVTVTPASSGESSSNASLIFSCE